MRRMPLVLLIVLAASCGPPRHRLVPKVPESADAFVRVKAGRFMLEGRETKFFGVNIYPLASRRSPQFTCGRPYADDEIGPVLAEVRALVPEPFVPTVRIWMFRQFPGAKPDWSRYDAILAEARRNGVKVILTFDDYWGACGTGKRHEASWYRLGYRRQDPDGLPSLRNHIREAVRRYRDNPAILMWQVINEAQSEEPLSLYAYAADLTALIKRYDPNHLVSFGTIGDDQDRPGAEGSLYLLLHRLNTIDVVEAHEYQMEPDGTWSAASLNCLDVAETLGKPCMVNEVGMKALTPQAKAERAIHLPQHIRTLFRLGVQATLVWSYRSGDARLDFDPSDPLYAAIQKGPLE